MEIRASIAGTVALLISAYVSSYIIAKSKIFFLGQKYWIRNLAASSIGETINTFLVFPIGMYGVISNVNLVKTITSALFFKLVFVIILIIPSIFFVYLLKKIEKLDHSCNNLIPSYPSFVS